MQKVRLAVGLVWLFVAASGCTNYSRYISDKMHKLGPDAAVQPPAEGQSQVIFMRPATVGYAVQSSVFDLRPDGDKLVGIVSTVSKVAYPTEPGEHLFMVIGENADFLRADLSPGKTYYVLVEPRLGWWKARFSMTPVRKESLGTTDFETWNTSTQLIENTDESRLWAQENWESIQDKKVDYKRKWDGKPQDERDAQTLKPEDGV